MNIKILDSWLREYVKTKATPKEFAQAMSLTSVSIERIEPYEKDFIYDIEVTTNRPDLLSVVGLAREAAAVLPHFDIEATFTPPIIEPTPKPVGNTPLTIIPDERLASRICAAVLEVDLHPSPEFIKERLETSDIRSLNNIVDITNYIMRTIGHPAHVFDYDRLLNHTLKIRESKKGEEITTLDDKIYTLPGGDIVADDGEGMIIDLLGIMGLANSVVTDTTKRIVLFIDNNDSHKLRKTSMSLGIRTEAVQLNEKGIDAELAMDALLYGIQLYREHARGTLIAPVIDIYPKPYKPYTVTVEGSEVQRIMGVPITLSESEKILKSLGFITKSKNEKNLTVEVPSYRAADITIPEDLIEEVARIYGYHNLPSILPPITSVEIIPFADNPFYWEKRAKDACKYWGFTEVYTYPMVSEDLYEGPTDDAVKLANPLGEDYVYMRRTLVPSLLKVVKENRHIDALQIFEIANVYEKKGSELPSQNRMFAGILKGPQANFFKAKGLIVQLAHDFGLAELTFKPLSSAGLETEVSLGKKVLGTIEILDESLINFELNFEVMTSLASLKKSYTPANKYPPINEDIAFTVDEDVATGTLIAAMYDVDRLISEVSLLDRYQDSRTFHVVYRATDRNLTEKEVSHVREALIKAIKTTFHATQKA